MTKTDVPAFPAPNYIYDSARIDKDAFQKMGLTQGMTLRDYFAGQALMGSMATPETNFLPDKECEKMAKWCYGIADAMIAEKGRRDASIDQINK